MAIRIAINGFGRIGRQITRLLAVRPEPGIELAAINSAEPIAQAAHLLRHDSVHGSLAQPVTADGRELVIGSLRLPFLNHTEPAALPPWRDLGVELVIESSGRYCHDRRAALHLAAGSRKVLITAAAQGPDITLCMGVNHQRYLPERHHIVSASSCTTNCLAPVAKLLHEHLGLRSLMATFLHSYTSGQHLLDLAGHDPRLMRAAPASLIPAPTSAAHQVPEVIPALAGRFTALSVRVPTPVVHLASLAARSERPTSVAEVLAIFRQAAAQGDLAGIVGVSDSPLVSIDFKGSQQSSILDAGSVMVVGGDLLQLLVWHDNESSYCKRIIDLVRYMATFSM